MFAKTFKLLDVFPHGGFSFVLYLCTNVEPLMVRVGVGGLVGGCGAGGGGWGALKIKCICKYSSVLQSAQTFQTLPFQYNT